MHKQVMHGGVRETFTHIRQTYWIPQGRQLVKRIISKCVTCRKVEGPPFRSVPTPPLPQSRVQQSYPIRGDSTEANKALRFFSEGIVN